MEKNYSSLEKKIKVNFKNKELLKKAFTHRSYINEHPGLKIDHNERLEFLGDAVLELVVTEHLFNKYPNPEGELTVWRAALVNTKMLSEIANELGFNDYLLLSKGEEQDTGRARSFILANTFEAFVGALYVDQGIERVADFINKSVLSRLPQILEEKLYLDPKSQFQEEAQSKEGITPSYELIEEDGPDHCKEFIVGVYLNDKLIAKGKGPSKQVAQGKAARKALEKKGWS
ncbi:MAG: ribonuclease III [Candidatus Portnoybacteria bacterium]|nr:ribonuclease III [Candidatus Portnoybacteria bacterium]